MTRKVLLLTIGAPALPAVTPIIPVATTDTVDPWTSPDVAPPTGLTVDPVVDGARIAWVKSTTVGADKTIIELAPDAGGSPGAWTVEATTTDQAWSLNLPDGPRYVRLIADLNGRQSAPTLPVLAIPDIPGGAYNVNLLVNAGFRTSLAGWTQYSNTAGGGWLAERDARTLSDRPVQTHNLALHHVGSPASGDLVYASEPVSAWPGETYMASAWLSRDDCQAFVGVMFFDAAGALLGSDYGTEAAATGGTNPANWNRRFIALAAPANSRSARLVFKVTATGGSAPAGFMIQPMLEHAAPGQTAPSNWHMGGSEGLMVYNIKVQNGTMVAGLELANDGTSTTFDVLSSAFNVYDPAGGDQLSWISGVITSVKTGYSVKIGPGFGASNNLLLWFGADGTTSTRTMANAQIAIPISGAPKLGGMQINYGGGWAVGGAVATYSATSGTPATATISVTSGDYRIDGYTINYGASSVNVSGTGGTTVRYYLYYDDPARAGGSQTLYASTDIEDTYNSGDKVFVQPIDVTFPTSGSGSGGGGGGYCPAEDAWMIRRSAAGGADLVQAHQVAVGDFVLLRSMRWGRVSFAERRLVERVCIVGADGGSLTCSAEAPIGTVGKGVVRASLAHEHTADCLHAGQAFGNYISTVQTRGEGWVIHLTVEDEFFWVGDTPDFLFAHHNRKMEDPL